MKFCKNCGAELPDEAVFCTTCGAVIEEDSSGTTVLNDVNDAGGTTVLADVADEEESSGTTVLADITDGDGTADETSVLSAESMEATAILYNNETPEKTDSIAKRIGKLPVKKTLKRVFAAIGIAAAVVCVILLAVRLNNLNYKNITADPVSLETVVIEGKDGKVEFSADETIGEICSNNGIYGIDGCTYYEVDGYQNDYVKSMDDVIDVDFYAQSELPVGSQTVNIFFNGKKGQCVADCKFGSFTIFRTNYGIEPGVINGLKITSTAKDVVKAWGQPDKVTNSDSIHLVKRFYYKRDGFRCIVFLDWLGRVDSVCIETV